MKCMIRLLSLALAMILAASMAFAEATVPSDDTVIALVNGEQLLYGDYAVIENSFLSDYYNAGLNLDDPALYAYVQDMALTYAIERIIIEQDMHAQGCYDFDKETTLWLTNQAQVAYLDALDQVAEMYHESEPTASEEELTDYALQYASMLGVSVQNYIDVLNNQYATVMYYEWLMGDAVIDEAAVQAAYEARVADAKTRFEGNAAAFEQAIVNGEEVWYKPEGYRNVLQILIFAEGETNEAKLASVQKTIDDIYARLDKGETFQSLIALYGTDPAFEDESFYNVGYQVHPDSVIWDDAFIATAFSEEMKEPGCWSKPVASTLGVHILYYLSDSNSGAVQMTEDLYDALAYTLYNEKTQALVQARLETLVNEAEVVIY